MNPLLLAGPIVELLRQVLGGLGLDPELKAKAEAHAFELATSGTFAEKADQAVQLAQLDVDKADASSGSNFRGGWRPAAGWVCVAALAFDNLIAPCLPWWLQVLGIDAPPMPKLDTSQTTGLLCALLGLGGLRSIDKAKGNG
jgi:hypothetical protein